ncbi:MAG: MCE family protein [Candidatus Tectomicrobia bacterium]|uniref:MCE family protein n=1 Tax=Tectimicrobiota bacterium TaxID=2528274 RepID=A0A937VYU8_UNCTE|nr:MCE family protein [Candidatus Tectomicrobia bacterium]
MEYFRPDVRVGAFIVIALGLLITLAIAVGGVGQWFESMQEYTVLLPNANLLRTRAKVSYAGSPIGEVSAIAVHTNPTWQQQYPSYPVAVTIAVRQAMALRADARIELRTDGFIGERYLDIVPGQGQPLAPGGMVLGVIGGVEGIIASFAGAGGGLDELSMALRGLLVDTSREQSLPATLGSARRFIEELRPHLLELTEALQTLATHAQRQLHTTGEQAGRTLTQLDTAVADNSAELKRLIRALHTTLGEVNRTMATAQKTLGTATTVLTTTQGDAKKLLGQVRELTTSVQRSTEDTLTQLQRVLARVDEVIAQNNRNLYTSVEHLRDTAEHLKAATRQVRNNPSVLLWGNGGQKEPEAPREADTTLRVLQDRGRVGRYDKLQ